ncbi:MAG: gliding motility-associated C-terminal domain-containing protein, partial [Saprospiraceae bacterium]|nr:gliding motility-associated C-terminal domain-containing protein [Saprospiraceae bacterium]
IIIDQETDTSFSISIEEPPPLSIAIASRMDASCFGICDGSLELEARGGVGNYDFQWEDRPSGDSVLNALCAGVYRLTLTDANGCTLEEAFPITQPPEFQAEIVVEKEVSCFGGRNGRLRVITNGEALNYEWGENLPNASVIDGLAAGNFSVTVTDADGCKDEASAVLTQPEAPVRASIQLDKPVSCFGGSDGALRAVGEGPGVSFSYLWEDGQRQAQRSGLEGGTYSVTVSNEKGCVDSSSFALPQPDPIQATLEITDLTCRDPDFGGAISLSSTTGGRGGYRYSLDGLFFQQFPIFENLAAGSYDVRVRDSLSCEAEFSATVMPPPDLRVDLGGDINLRLGDSIRIRAEANSDDLEYEWRPPEIAEGVSGGEIVLRPFQNTVVSVEVTDTLTFCTAADRIFVTVDKTRRVYIPNAFSPNGDGQNDIFMIYGGPGLVKVKRLAIYSRNGGQLLELTDFQPDDPRYGWDGRYRSQPMPSGVYVFLAEIEFLDGKVEVFSGDVSLFR